jgi:multidrug efflux system outer membrane protein
MTRLSLILCASAVATLGLSGCVPKKQAYRQPTLPVAPSVWQDDLSAEEHAQASPATAPAAADLKWQDVYTDENLQKVITLALNNNRDLRVALLNVEKTAAQYRLQRAQQFPTVNGVASGSAQRLPSNVSGLNKSYVSESDSIGAQVSSWELDLFHRLRSLSQQQFELYLASDEGRRDTQVALISSVATSYLTLAADQQSLALAQQTLASQQATYDLIRQSSEHGIGSNLDVSEALSQVEAARADIARYQHQVSADNNALAVLVGAPVDPALLPKSMGDGTSIKDVSAGIPSETLLRRPDIREAEHSLKSAYANLDAARADYFPKIALTANGGVLSNSLANLFKGGPGTWLFNPQVSLPIFDAGTRAANYKLAEVARDTYVAQYEKAIQTAFQEVSDALNGRVRLLEEENAQTANVKALAETYHLTEARYKAGIDNYQAVLVAQRSLYSGQVTLISLHLARLSNQVTLYKALGGGAL